MFKEANIFINGVELSQGESMTVRVALESFAMDLSANGLGDDEHGVKMTAGYLKNISNIREKLYEK